MAIGLGITERLLTTREAAGILHVHTNTLRRWCDSGVIKAYRIGSRGDRRIPEDSVKSVLSQESAGRLRSEDIRTDRLDERRRKLGETAEPGR